MERRVVVRAWIQQTVEIRRTPSGCADRHERIAPTTPDRRRPGAAPISPKLPCSVIGPLEERIPKDHPPRKLRVVVDAILAAMEAQLDALYATTGRDSIPPVRLLRARLIQTLFFIRCERQQVNPLDDNLPYHWFVGLA